VDAAQALAHLTQISSQIEAAVLFDDDGVVTGSTVDAERARELVRLASELLEEAARTGSAERALTQLEVATDDGSVLVVRDARRRIVATTQPDPTVGLVFYDLKSCLRESADEASDAPKDAEHGDAPAESEPGDAS
jgi:predicted regulator of Ras-like GTPase activity (Roadblock/LC7/MglB family)